MNERERNSMTAHAKVYEAYLRMPIKLRAQVAEYLEQAIELNRAAMYSYRDNIRSEVLTGIINSNINQPINDSYDGQ